MAEPLDLRGAPDCDADDAAPASRPAPRDGIPGSAHEFYLAAQRLLLHRIELLLVETQETVAPLLRGAALSLVGALLAVAGWVALVVGLVQIVPTHAGPAVTLAWVGAAHAALGATLAVTGVWLSRRARRRHATGSDAGDDDV